MLLTIGLMRKCYKNPPSESAQKIIVDSLNKYFPKYSINTELRMIHFIAQCLHESADFNLLIENMNYSSKGLSQTWPSRFQAPDGKPNKLAISIAKQPIAIGNYVYANRYGNGDTNSGDGYRYRGRGPFHLTFKDNYAAFGKHAGLDLVSHPEDVQWLDLGIMSACWYWSNAKCNMSADNDDLNGVTRKINGGLIGIESRRQKLALVKAAFEYKDHAV